MLGSYGWNHIADQRHREAQEEARRHRLAVEAEAALRQDASGRQGHLRRVVDRAAVAIRWAARVTFG